MPSPHLTKLRQLRDRSLRLSDQVAGDLTPFGFGSPRTFKWLPDATAGRISVATTCTGIMAGIIGNRIGPILEVKDKDKAAALRGTLDAIRDVPWDSSRLPDNNAFTTAMVGRTAGIVAADGVLERDYLKGIQRTIRGKTESLEKILKRLASSVPAGLSVQGYPPTPTIGYWLVDALDNLNVDIGDKAWSKIVQWAAGAFSAEFSRVVAKHDALMDPISLAMAACLSKRLRRICARDGFPRGHEIAAALPSAPELSRAVELFCSFQGPSGIWPKYFPLFHYPEKGANYCLSFEVLEALILEFGESDVLLSESALGRLDQAVGWCVSNRVTLTYGGTTYAGWNSGGDRLSLESGQPEFWATGVIHMFLARLIEMLRRDIQKQVLERYRVPVRYANWKALIDVDVPIPSEGDPQSLKTILEDEMIRPIEEGRLGRRRSALLFGPPGTSKTTLVRALAAQIGWPCIELDPSHFLVDGLERIYARAQDIFDDLSDLTRVVVLFDEMDALVQRRDEHLDVTRQFLTTSMLPRLAKLHGARDVLFFFATNHLGYFDEAIKRPGRFDLLLLVQPPRWSAKIERLEVFCETEADASAVDSAKSILSSWLTVGDDATKELDRFTVDELASMFDHVRRKTKLATTSEALEAFGRDNFRRLVADWAEKYITVRKQNAPVWSEFENDLRSSRRQ